jgi:ligand-binding SRPBCC domain-containing protein
VKTYSLRRSQFLPIPIDVAWKFFSSPENLGQITPARMNMVILSKTGGAMHTGQLITYRVTVFPLIRVTWVTEITSVVERTRFTDEQRTGPYALWHHTHSFDELNGGVQMNDEVVYALPLGVLGQLAHWLFVGRALRSIFDYRFQVLEKHFQKK